MKTASTAEVVAAIRKLAAGAPLLSLAEASLLATRAREVARHSQSELTLLSSLSSRERDVLAGIAAGLDNKAIAAMLSVSTDTVRSHVVSILRKLRVKSRLQAALLANRHDAVKTAPLSDLSLKQLATIADARKR